MDAQNILYYTDGHQVMITNGGFKVKNTLYRLNGITQHGLSIIYPQRIPSVLLMVCGIVLFVCGAMNFVPPSWGTHVNLLGFSLIVNSVMMTGGVLFLLAGLFIMLKQREKYAVRISTAEGEKDVVVSPSREYVNQIVDALNRAYLDLIQKPDKIERKQLKVLG